MAMLTKTFISEVQRPSSDYGIHWDERLPGYGLRVTANGERSFVAQGRVAGKAAIITIWRFGRYTEDQARGLAQKILLQMREGIAAWFIDTAYKEESFFVRHASFSARMSLTSS